MVLNRQRTVRVARPPLEAFLARVREQLRLHGSEITIALVSDKSIAQMNETFRHKKGPTDVLSFPADARDAGQVAPAPLPAVFPTGEQNSTPQQNPPSRRTHVRAQAPCAPGPQDRSVKTSRIRTSFAPSRPSRGRRQHTHGATREGTPSAVPNRATTKGASAPEAHSLGDIAISPATARRNAKKFNRTLPSELQILILHGVLHLLGYDHETDNGQMTRVENRLRRKLGLR